MFLNFFRKWTETIRNDPKWHRKVLSTAVSYCTSIEWLDCCKTDVTEILNRLIRKVLSSKTEFRRFRTVSNGFGRFRTVSDCFRTVSDGFGPFLDRFGSVSGVLRPFRTTLFLILKISNFNWPRLGPVRAVPSVRAVPPSRGQLKFEILQKNRKNRTKTNTLKFMD